MCRMTLLLLHFFIFFTYVKCYNYQTSWNSDYNSYQQVLPQEIMVDVINNLGLHLLAIHNDNNENNIAISPYGAASVLVALREGVRGEAVREIHNAAHIPRDISITRVGLRDIHRHLKSYFIPKEGFLAGLTLSHDNVTLHSEYEKVLRFYGYDIDSFNNALYPDPDTTLKPMSSSELVDLNDKEVSTTEEVTIVTNEMADVGTTQEQKTEKITTMKMTERITTEMVENTTKEEVVAEKPTTENNKAITEEVGTEKDSEDKVATEKVATTEKVAVDKVATENVSIGKITTEKVATEKITTQQIVTEKVTTENIATEEIVTEKIATEKVETERYVTDISTTNKITTQQKPLEAAITEKIATERDVTEKSTTNQITTEQKPLEAATTTKIGTENVATERDVTEKSTTNKITTEQKPSEAATTEKIATERDVTEKLTTNKITTEQKPLEDATTTKIGTENVATERDVTEKSTTNKITTEQKPLEAATTEKIATERDVTENSTTNKITTEQKPFEDVTTENIPPSDVSLSNSITTTKNEIITISENKLGPITTERTSGENVTKSTETTSLPIKTTSSQTTEQTTTLPTTLFSRSEITTTQNGGATETQAREQSNELTTQMTTNTEASTNPNSEFEIITPTEAISSTKSENEDTTESVQPIKIVSRSSSPLEDLPDSKLIEKTAEFESRKLSESVLATTGYEYEDATTERHFESSWSSSQPENQNDSKRDIRSVVDYVLARYYDNYNVPNKEYYRPQEHLTFLVNGKHREGNISFMAYDTVLPFYYISHLNALALSFPLDSTKYYLLLILPVDENGVDKLVCDLKKTTSLKHIIQNLKYTHIKAVIPSFTLKGYVILTPTLQKLGIRSIFEPRHADFSPMTDERDIYVTNIEQAITVTIRNYVDPNKIQNHRNLYQYGPVEFKADHPFLYFVIDAEIHVTLMAGKIINPLNSRIR